MCAAKYFFSVLVGLTYAKIIFLLTEFANGTFTIELPLPGTSKKIDNTTNNNNNSDIDFALNPGQDVQFILFTRQYSPHNIQVGDAKGLRKSGFNSTRPTKIIIHGFLSNIKADVFIVNRNAYMEAGDFNVIGMDWSPLCEFEYLSALRGVQTAGNRLAELLNWFSSLGITLDNFHIIGHSLGAHVAGIAGHATSKKIGRITGLDPANPGFRDLPKRLKLDASDAKLVDVIHTFMQVLGIAQPLPSSTQYHFYIEKI